MSRPRHPDKHIEKAVKYAESLGWRVKMSEGHAWGHISCPAGTRDGCQFAVFSTPAIPRAMRAGSSAGSTSAHTHHHNTHAHAHVHAHVQ